MAKLTEHQKLKIIRRHYTLAIGMRDTVEMLKRELDRAPTNAAISELEMCDDGSIILTFQEETKDDE